MDSRNDDAMPHGMAEVAAPIPPAEQQRRLDAVRRLLDANECDALLVYGNGWAPGGVIYLTGWATQTQAWCAARRQARPRD